MKRRRLSKAERESVYEKTAGHCAYCGAEIKYNELVIDHVIPLRRGGADELENMLPACRPCNHRKGTFTVEEFRREIERQVSVLEKSSVTYRNAVRFGLIIPNPHKVKFYYEKILSYIKKEMPEYPEEVEK